MNRPTTTFLGATLVIATAYLGVSYAGERVDNLHLPPCSKQFVRAWNDFNLAMSRADPNDPKSQPEMPPLPKKPCRLVSSNYHSYICSEAEQGCGQ